MAEILNDKGFKWTIEMLNFQEVGGKVKAYQVKQFVRVVEKYNLLEE